MIDPARREELRSIAILRAAELIVQGAKMLEVADVCKTNEEARFFRETVTSCADLVKGQL